MIRLMSWIVKMSITKLHDAKAEMKMHYESGLRLKQSIDEHERIYTVNYLSIKFMKLINLVL